MRFTELPIAGAFLVDLEPRGDVRGLFARTFCAREFETHGLNPTVVQSNLAVTYRRGTVRGLHYQTAPAAETKLLRCVRGAVYDVIVDVRPSSPSYLKHVGVELTADDRRALYVPAFVANGYQALTDDVEVMYDVSGFYTPETEQGVRFDDPAIGIDWPLPPDEVSLKDRSWPLLAVRPSLAQQREA